MRYLILIADYTQSCIHDDFSGPLRLADLSLPTEIVTQLEQWNERYKAIIPLSDKDRIKQLQLIHDLDKQGLLLSSQLQNILNAKVKYFSEGLLQYLSPK